MPDRFARHSWACLVLWSFAAIAPAQTTPLPTGPAIALEEALARTMAGNPELAAFGHRVDAALGRLQQAHIAPNPELDLAVADALGTDDYRGLRSAETTVTIAWVLERGIRRRQVDAAVADVSLREVETRIMQLDAAAETARRFLACLAYQARLENAVRAVGLAAETVDAVRRRVAAGGAARAELSRAEAGLVRAGILEEEYTHELLSAYHRLSAQWGAKDPDFNRVEGNVRKLPAVQPLTALLSRVDSNPDLALFLSRRRLAEAELHIAQARSRPNWRVHAGVRRIERTDDLALVGGISVPLGTRSRHLGRIAETRAEMARAQGEARARRVHIEAALFVLHQELLHHVNVAASLRDRVIPLLESALDSTHRAYVLGRGSYLELSAVQAELLQVDGELLETGVDAHGLVVEIERLTGVPVLYPAAAQRGQP
ncbi:MAG: TolC family protein [Gammaproteobacteria bacterium]|nr:TolC family protein [Gammaproteobacteria bacterium]MDE0366164.1 TolC family protein [Gammaproteobacteria bacterium]